MKNATNRYLDALAKQAGGATDYRLAKMLECGQPAISSYRAGNSHLSNKTAFKVAQMLGLDPADVIAQVEIDRAKTDEDRNFWKGRGGKVAAIAVSASILLAAVLPQKANAVSALRADFQSNKNIHYKYLAMISSAVSPAALRSFISRGIGNGRRPLAMADRLVRE